MHRGIAELSILLYLNICFRYTLVERDPHLF